MENDVNLLLFQDIERNVKYLYRFQNSDKIQ